MLSNKNFKKREYSLKEFYDVLFVEKNKRIQEYSKYDWASIARDKQKIPNGDWYIWLILAGRGFGKTRTGAESIRHFVKSGEYKNIAFIANTQNDAREVMVEGESGILKVTPKSENLKFEPTRRLLTWANGAKARIYSAENIEQLRGPQFDCVWIDELAKFKNGQELMDQVTLCLRLSKKPRIIITSTPRPNNVIKSLCNCNRPDVIITKGSTYENQNNLSNEFIRQIKEKFEGSTLGAQEIYAEIIDYNKGWWNKDILKRSRIYELNNKIKKIFIGVDPAITNNSNSDETGIIVVGLDYNGYFYVLDDYSQRSDPIVWCKQIIDLTKIYKVNCIIIEVNAGGSFIQELLKTLGNKVPIKNVYAKESKESRTLPIFSLYEQNKVFHTKEFTELEDEMLVYPNVKKSPDRIDALTWAISELLKEQVKHYKVW